MTASEYQMIATVGSSHGKSRSTQINKIVRLALGSFSEDLKSVHIFTYMHIFFI